MCSQKDYSCSRKDERDGGKNWINAKTGNGGEIGCGNAQKQRDSESVDIIEFLEKAGFVVGFETYELVVEGCLECGEFVLAGKVVMRMTERGFIPYIRARQKLVEGLVSVGEQEFASAVRQKFVELKS